MKKIAFGAALAVLAGPALAADPVVYEPAPTAVPVAAAYDWTGFYVGGHAGYGSGDAEAVDTDAGGDFFDEAFGQTHNVDVDGFVGGAQAGYNWQSGSFVYGVEADLGYLGVDGENFTIPSPDNFGAVEYGAYGDLTARLGFAANTVLFYAKGGVAAANVELSFGDLIDGSSDIDPTSSATEDSTEVGYTIGGGIEWAFAQNWSTKVEYQYFDFGTVDLADTQGDTAEVDLNLHTIKLGINYRF